MPRIVRCGVIQASCEWSPEKYSLAEIKEKMIAKHEKLIADGGQEESEDSRPAGAFLRAVLLRRARRALVRTDREGAGRADARAHAKAGQEIRDGAGGAGLRSGDDRSFLQHRGRFRCGRQLPGEISQAPHSALPSGLLGEVLFHAGKRGLSRVSRRATAESACTSATTGISRRARAFWD